MKTKNKGMIISVIAALAVGALSGLVTMDSMKSYAGINKPPLSPAPIVFPIVWGILFTLMGISAALIYFSDSDEQSRKNALSVYVVQLIINFLWPIIFFNYGAYVFAFVWLILLIAAVSIMIVLFYRIYPLAAYLQIPYFVWLLFAAYLNLGIALLN